MIRTALIIKLGAIGDVVMASPMTSALAQAYPGLRLSWLCGRIAAPLARMLPDVDEVVEIDEQKLLAGGSRERARVLAEAAATMRWPRYDLVLNGHPAPHYRILETLVRGRTVRRFSRLPGRRVMPVPGRYHGDEYVRLALGGDGSGAEPAEPVRIVVPPPAWLGESLKGEGAVIGLAPGGARNVLADDALRRWPIRRYRELVRRLRIDGHRVVIVGGSGDGWVRDEIGAVDGVVDAVGRTTLTELVGVLGACDVVVTHDSGPMHLALAAGTPLVALFGPTNPAERIPRAAEAVTVLHGGAELPCRPCYDGRTYAACDTRECLHQIEVDGVHRAVKERIIPA